MTRIWIRPVTSFQFRGWEWVELLPYMPSCHGQGKPSIFINLGGLWVKVPIQNLQIQSRSSCLLPFHSICSNCRYNGIQTADDGFWTGILLLCAAYNSGCNIFMIVKPTRMFHIKNSGYSCIYSRKVRQKQQVDLYWLKDWLLLVQNTFLTLSSFGCMITRLDCLLELLPSLPLQPLQPPSEMRSIVISIIVSVTTTFSSQDCFLRTETITVFPSYLPCCTVLCLKLCSALTCHDVSFTDGSCCFDMCKSSGIWANAYEGNWAIDKILSVLWLISLVFRWRIVLHIVFKHCLIVDDTVLVWLCCHVLC